MTPTTEQPKPKGRQSLDQYSQYGSKLEKAIVDFNKRFDTIKAYSENNIKDSKEVEVVEMHLKQWEEDARSELSNLAKDFYIIDNNTTKK